ncbi:hypothetical protein [Actinoplanes sp. NPDC051851]|uniref:hypothetical protein n=1 Tax=Actinoplanes sp. NPDC051851 TaxID=3154753 RepID=UPI00342FE91E
MRTDVGVNVVEYFVLHEADGDATLAEMIASWTGNGTAEQRTDAVPLLRQAVLRLASRGLVEVTPGHSPADLADTLAEPGSWASPSPLTLSVTEAGVPYL